MSVGRIRAIHRYPVKSMAGETLSSTRLGPLGLPGDRAWAVRDEVRGGIRGAKKIGELMQCAARYREEPGDGTAPPAEITLPSGETLLSNAPDAAERVSKAIGHDVTVWPLAPADDLDHYRRGAPDDTDMMKELRTIFAREPDEPLPDLGKFPPDLLQYESPPGTYFDAYPLLLLSDASLRSVGAAAPASRFDVRRFRPNLLIETADDAPFPENAWAGSKLRIGDAILSVEIECPRCVMTTRGFADLPKDPTIMRTLVRESGGNLGIYASVDAPGTVRTGDPIELL